MSRDVNLSAPCQLWLRVALEIVALHHATQMIPETFVDPSRQTAEIGPTEIEIGPPIFVRLGALKGQDAIARARVAQDVGHLRASCAIDTTIVESEGSKIPTSACQIVEHLVVIPHVTVPRADLGDVAHQAAAVDPPEPLQGHLDLVKRLAGDPERRHGRTTGRGRIVGFYAWPLVDAKHRGMVVTNCVCDHRHDIHPVAVAVPLADARENAVGSFSVPESGGARAWSAEGVQAVDHIAAGGIRNLFGLTLFGVALFGRHRLLLPESQGI